jgi:hypothetical protein
MTKPKRGVKLDAGCKLGQAEESRPLSRVA